MYFILKRQPHSLPFCCYELDLFYFWRGYFRAEEDVSVYAVYESVKLTIYSKIGVTMWVFFTQCVCLSYPPPSHSFSLSLHFYLFLSLPCSPSVDLPATLFPLNVSLPPIPFLLLSLYRSFFLPSLSLSEKRSV